MILKLSIWNLILIDQVHIEFGPGLNILSGETGSGKSAILSALKLITGARADVGMVRSGFQKGRVEATFSHHHLPELLQILAEGGIEHAEGEELIVSREISRDGKGSAFVNQQRVTLAFLKRVGSSLLTFSGQQMSQKLASIDYHRHVVDLYGNLMEPLAAYTRSWERCKELEKRLEAMQVDENTRLSELTQCRKEFSEIEVCPFEEGEEETLFAEYTHLVHSEQIHEDCQTLIIDLDSEVCAKLQRLHASLEKMLCDGKSFEVITNHLATALLELREACYLLEKQRGDHEPNPAQRDEINTRLEKITSLKQKYGESVAAIERYQQHLQHRIDELENHEVKVAELTEALEGAWRETERLALELSQLRDQSRAFLQEQITEQLHTLNMPKARFSIERTCDKLTSFGADRVEFFLAPNPGEAVIPMKDCVSGGELSRVMLAIHSLMAGKEGTPTLLFDEIDANIGGATAVIVGVKLKKIARERQVLCITHFSQVAQQGDHHFCICKEQKGGRTLTVVTKLGAGERSSEIHRMQGLAALKN